MSKLQVYAKLQENFKRCHTELAFGPYIVMPQRLRARIIVTVTE